MTGGEFFDVRKELMLCAWKARGYKKLGWSEKMGTSRKGLRLNEF